MNKIDYSKITIPDGGKYSFTTPSSDIIFCDNSTGEQREVMRITKDGITSNPDVTTDEGAKAIIRALDGYIKNLVNRTWVGLTDEEMMDAIYVDDTPMERGRRVESKLRSKNTRGARMTKDEIIEMAIQAGFDEHHAKFDTRIEAFAKLVAEKAIKEALAQEQEPVAWMFQHEETGRMNYVSNDGIHDPTMFLGMNPRYALVCPLYTTPPQRKTLTDEEIKEIFLRELGDMAVRIPPGWRKVVSAIEAAHGIKE